MRAKVLPIQEGSALTERKRRAVFLDRDGTINVEKDYLYRPEDFEFYPGVPLALKKLKESGYFLIVVTNQSGVARGYFTLAEVDALHNHLQKRLHEFGTEVDGFYICPHHPEQGSGEYRKQCDCRKGEPGLLLKGAADFRIDMAESYMIGDKLSDIEAGIRAGCQPVLVLTGYGTETSQKLQSEDIPIFDNLSRAVEYILSLNS